MIELLSPIGAELVDEKEGIQKSAAEPNEEGVMVNHLHVAADDMGKVIGRQGRIAKAIRTLMRAAAARNNEKAAVEIE